MNEKIKICPKCGSTNIGIGGDYIPQDFCKDCGFGKFEFGINEFPYAKKKPIKKKNQKQ
jgi:hypothetical protein